MTTHPSNTGESFAQALRTLASLIPQKIEETDPLHQQRLYEKWSQREEWSVRKEAIPLLLGRDPETWERLIDASGPREAEVAAWEDLKANVIRQGRPRISNPTDLEEEWRIQPAALVPWARSAGVEVPEYLETLLQFILNVVKKPAGAQDASALPRGITATPQNQTQDRERVLGAALNILAKCSEQCYDSHGFVSGKAIVKLIQQQSMRWFDSPQPPMNPADMAAFIDKWLE